MVSDLSQRHADHSDPVAPSRAPYGAGGDQRSGNALTIARRARTAGRGGQDGARVVRASLAALCGIIGMRERHPGAGGLSERELDAFLETDATSMTTAGTGMAVHVHAAGGECSRRKTGGSAMRTGGSSASPRRGGRERGGPRRATMTDFTMPA